MTNGRRGAMRTRKFLAVAFLLLIVAAACLAVSRLSRFRVNGTE